MACSELFPGFYKINLPIPRGGFESFLDGWFIKDEARAQNILVETGPASAVPELFARLEELGNPMIDYLIYTHIHLDHAGGAGISSGVPRIRSCSRPRRDVRIS